jgi:hypothetical protein
LIARARLLRAPLGPGTKSRLTPRFFCFPFVFDGEKKDLLHGLGGDGQYKLAEKRSYDLDD